MNLSDWLVVLSLLFATYGVGRWLWVNYFIARLPRLPQAAPAVPASPRPEPSAGRGGAGSRRRIGAFKGGSPRSSVQNAVNPRSTHQDANEPAVNVPANVQETGQSERETPTQATASPPDGALLISPRELVQLAEALNLRREGGTVEQAVSRAFGVSKGGSEGWKRAKLLFDAATAMPGAAPEGSYVAPTPPPRKRRVAKQ